ncbi:MAG: hypothetical protein FJ096_17345 [Deltaproteobacteria bacterium]|nr:hypothetical protein [Deltaproteobacteria bacterium]
MSPLDEDRDDDAMGLVLTPEVVEDEEELGLLVDELVRRDPVAQRRLKEINSQSELLRGAVEHEVWQLVLEIEARANERWSDLLVTLARFAQRFLDALPHGGWRRKLPVVEGSVDPDERAQLQTSSQLESAQESRASSSDTPSGCAS